MAATLEHRYDNQSVWHYKGGYMQILEEELVLARPPHDDVKDALASAIAITIKPKKPRGLSDFGSSNVIQTHRKFGGVAFK